MDEALSKVLIVDDHRSNRVALEKLIESVPHIDIHHAVSGENALALLIHHTFSLILLDVNMPEMDGYEVAELILNSQSHKHTPIVMLTAHDSSNANILKAYQAGAVDYLSKPVEPTILLNKVKQFVTLDQLRAKTETLKAEKEQILEIAGQGVLKLNDKGIIQFVNSKSAHLIEREESELLQTHFNQWFTAQNTYGLPINNLFNHIQSQVLALNQHQQQVTLIVDETKTYQVEITCTSQLNVANAPMIILFQDITQRLELEERLTHLANYDLLTQLANRLYFHNQLERALHRSKRVKSTVALLMLDLDHFKEINDTLGHDIGDQLLQAVSLRLLKTIRESDLVARLGGDEFVILLEDSSELATETVAKKILASISNPFTIQGKEIFIDVSIGISHTSNGEHDQTVLLKWADIALYRAKAIGRNGYQLFLSSMSEHIDQQALIQHQLRSIIENNDLVVYYQPQFSVKQDCIVGVEALARWPLAGYGDKQISPATFIPIAEQSHLIHELGLLVLHKACALLTKWNHQKQNQHLTISVNLSAKQLNSPNLLASLENVFNQYDFPLSQLILEITETMILNNVEQSVKTIDAIKLLGVKLALDDFGTGYSSLNYLQTLPFDIIKIDQCFIQRLDQCQKTGSLVKAIMSIADACSMDVVSEGVETKEQLKEITKLGGDKIQGYYFSKPINEEALLELLPSNTIVY